MVLMAGESKLSQEKRTCGLRAAAYAAVARLPGVEALLALPPVVEALFTLPLILTDLRVRHRRKLPWPPSGFARVQH
ncbi:hypothetical protein E2562_000016 [Oryza meyeriana var. granulata]|uniref:Uncharacterized protein n=1 Tax=Oryza meyeriana var. granulata TaxID=110450 RepID=A0A6G1DBX4_9ORYZ|nr:hypothetical protein E2562_000016 [Oryza meyeriana var. granulata]